MSGEMVSTSVVMNSAMEPCGTLPLTPLARRFRQAFSEITPTSSTWTFAKPDARLWWGDLWANRIIESNFGAQAKEFGFADDAELAELAAAWREWGAQPDGFFVCPHAECIAIA